MPRLELIFLHSANGGGCFRWPDKDSTEIAFGGNAPINIGLDEKKTSEQIAAALRPHAARRMAETVLGTVRTFAKI
jgi:hypothetical protein